MQRRGVLRVLGVAAVAAATGCVDQATLIGGVNETLEIRNHSPESVSLDVLVEESTGTEAATVFDETVTVEAGATKALDVLGDNQYYLTVGARDRTHEFGTRPICDRAFTRIIVTETGALDSEIADCE